MRDILVPGSMLAIVASILLPLPPAILDILVVINLLLGCLLLISTLYIGDPLKLSSLPTILLFATLFRLALNISTTRAILGSGNAGQVIEAFGEIVIQGNLIVGLVVFLIITIVQFIVIAKGAERVAEVAARFTLDALPGKQMSIDADVRAGLIDFEIARKKRQDLQIESRFYGALDGAMKFIKGDSLAGMLTVGINLLGGFSIGVFFHGMTLSAAATQFSILTIGDGLASQIPALLNALAAGMVVTRVSRGDNQSIAAELPQQLGQLKIVKVLVGLLSCLIALLPGMPAVPFILIGVLSVLLGIVHKTEAKATISEGLKSFEPRTPGLLTVQIGVKAKKMLQDLSIDLNNQFTELRERLFQSLGVVLAKPEFIVDPNLDAHLNFGQLKFLIRGIATGIHAVPNEAKAALDIIKQLENLLVERVAELMDDQHTRRILDVLEQQAPDLVAAVVPNIASLTQVTVIFRDLLKEGISLRNSELIVQAIAERSNKSVNERQLLEYVRISLQRAICSKFIQDTNSIYGYSLAALLDLAFYKAEREGQPIDPLALAALVDFYEKDSHADSILVVSQGARALVRDCLAVNKHRIKVIAYEEIPSDIKFICLGKIGQELKELEDETTIARIAA